RCLCRCFCSYRALPCFPTRRSSDLVDDTAALATGDTLYLHIAAAVVSVVFDGQVIIDVLRTGSGKGAARDKFRAILLQADIQAVALLLIGVGNVVTAAQHLHAQLRIAL